jgi:hypothetical protein
VAIFLWQPKWNSRLLEAFKVNYVGTDPYVSCTPALCHHRISAQDKFLVLSSDGLYQYFTNKEVVDQVEAFTAAQPDGDPAQHLVGELVIRAARKAGEQRSRVHSAARSNRLLETLTWFSWIFFHCRHGVARAAGHPARREEALP